MTSYLDKQPAQSLNDFNDPNEDSALLADLQAILDEDEQLPISLDHVLDDNDHIHTHNSEAPKPHHAAKLIDDQCDNIYIVKPLTADETETVPELGIVPPRENITEKVIDLSSKPDSDFYRDYKDDFDNEYQEALSASDLKARQSMNTGPSKPVNLKVKIGRSGQEPHPLNKPASGHMSLDALAGTTDKLKHDESQAPATNDVGMAMVVLSQFRTKQDSINKQYETQLQDYKDRAQRAVFISYLVLVIGIAALLFSLVLGTMLSEMRHQISDLSKTTAQLNKELLEANEKITATETKNTQLAPVTATPLTTVPGASPTESPVTAAPVSAPAQTINPSNTAQTPALSPASVISRSALAAAAKKAVSDKPLASSEKPAATHAPEKPATTKTLKKPSQEAASTTSKTAAPVANKPKPAPKSSEAKAAVSKTVKTDAAKTKTSPKPASTTTKPAPVTKKAAPVEEKPKAKPNP